MQIGLLLLYETNLIAADCDNFNRSLADPTRFRKGEMSAKILPFHNTTTAPFRWLDQPTDRQMEQSLILLKPDCVERRLIGRVIARFEDKALNLVGMKMIRITPDLAKKTLC